MATSEQLAAERVAERAATLDAMTSDQHRAEAIRLMAIGQRTQRDSLVVQAQWHAAMVLVEQGRGR